MSLLHNLKTDAEINAHLARCLYDTKLTAVTFWPETFDSPFADAHDDLFKLIDSREKQLKQVVVGGRGVGKTSILRALVARLVLFRLKHFIVYISKSEEAAIESTEEIKRMLLDNEYIKRLPVFGNIKERLDSSAMEDSFSKKGWVAHWPGDGGEWPIKVLPRGAGQQIRGRLFQFHRPDFIVLDDLEDSETINNETIREKNYKYVISDVARAVSRTKDDWQIVYIDTLKHEDSVMAKLLASKTWKHHRMPLCDENYRTCMHPFVTQAMVDADVSKARADGDLDEFARENMCMAISQEAAKFKRNYFQYYSEKEPPEQGMLKVGQDANVQNIVLADPAKTTGDKSCKSAIVVWGIDQTRRRFYLRHIDKGRYHPSELIDRYLDALQGYRCVVGGIEVTGLEEFIKWPLEQAMIQRNLYTPIEWCKARGKKENRAGMLENIYRRRQVWHNEEIGHLIEPALLSYPRPAEWDVLDAAAYLFEVMRGKNGSLFLTGGEPKYEQAAEAGPPMDVELDSVGDGLYRTDGLSTIGENLWNQDRGLTVGTRSRLPRSAYRSTQHQAM